MRPIWNEFQHSGVVVEDDDDDADDADDEKQKTGDGVKMYLQKQGRCFRLERNGSTGMTLTPRPRIANIHDDGLYVRVGSGVYDGRGLILGPRSPFKNIPILGWLL